MNTWWVKHVARELASHDSEIPRPKPGWRSTRVEAARLELEREGGEWDETTTPRLGRRESEPHSDQVTYLYDVLTTNFPDDRTLWDLHHYFRIDDEEVDIQFDISYFRGLNIPYTLSSYRASDFGNRVPTMAVNVLSRSTMYKDLSLTVELCDRLNIPVYVVFNPYLAHVSTYKAPFLRVYYRSTSEQQGYEIKQLQDVSFREDGTVDPEKVIDVGDLVPFKLGIQRYSRLHQGGLPQYRIVLLDSESLKVLPTRAEQERQRAEQAERRAEQAEHRAEQAERRAEQAEHRAEQAERRAEHLERELQELKKKLGLNETE